MGAQVGEQQLTSFRKVQTTYAEVLNRIGSPTSQTLTSEGGRTASWTYVEAKARPESFIPIVGPLVGGSDTKLSVVMLRFDSNGVLQEFSATSSAMGAGTGPFTSTQRRSTPIVAVANREVSASACARIGLSISA